MIATNVPTVHFAQLPISRVTGKVEASTHTARAYFGTNPVLRITRISITIGVSDSSNSIGFS
jgi:hypothetical protein